jgi:hypothetical protein
MRRLTGTHTQSWLNTRYCQREGGRERCRERERERGRERREVREIFDTVFP